MKDPDKKNKKWLDPRKKNVIPATSKEAETSKIAQWVFFLQLFSSDEDPGLAKKPDQTKEKIEIFFIFLVSGVP